MFVGNDSGVAWIGALGCFLQLLVCQTVTETRDQHFLGPELSKDFVPEDDCASSNTNQNDIESGSDTYPKMDMQQHFSQPQAPRPAKDSMPESHAALRGEPRGLGGNILKVEVHIESAGIQRIILPFMPRPTCLTDTVALHKGNEKERGKLLKSS